MHELDMLRDHKPPPIRRIRISDFGLPDPNRDPDRHQNCITWSLSHALPLHKISSKSVHKFASNPTDRQTNRQTNRPQRKHNLLLSAEVMTHKTHSSGALCTDWARILSCCSTGCNFVNNFLYQFKEIPLLERLLNFQKNVFY